LFSDDFCLQSNPQWRKKTAPGNLLDLFFALQLRRCIYYWYPVKTLKMLKKFFRRADQQLPAPLAPAAAKPPASAPEGMAERRRVPRSLPVGEVIEGNGGDTEWGLWTEALQKTEQDDSFAPTELSPLRPK
jgi:hypothetical protein